MSRLADEVGNPPYYCLEEEYPSESGNEKTACAEKKKKMKMKMKKKKSSARFILPAPSSIMPAGALRQPVVPFNLSLQSPNTVPRHVL